PPPAHKAPETLPPAREARTAELPPVVAPPPVLQLAPVTGVTLEAGKTVALEVRVRRTNCARPVPPEVAGPPHGVRGLPARVAAGRDTARIELRAGEGAADGFQEATIRAGLGEVQTERTVLVTVKAGPPLRLEPVADAIAQSRQIWTVKVRVQRLRFQGPV